MSTQYSYNFDKDGHKFTMAIWRYGENYRVEIDNFHGVQEEVYREVFDTLLEAVERFNKLKKKTNDKDNGGD